MNYKEVQKRYDDTFSVREVEESAKDDEGKPRLSLVSPYLIEAVGRVRTYGTEKYGDPNSWEEVDAERYKDALLRHLCEYLKDPTSVDESGLNHLEHVACNVSFLLEKQVYGEF
jgi:hypothetical protein